MSANIHQRYSERLRRYTTAMHNQKPDRVPLRPFVAEFAAKYAGFTCQQATHDFEGALAATRKCAADFDWDATVGNMIYVWTGLTEAIGLTYYGAPGIHVPADVGFQYREPEEDNAHMRADEYDALIADPSGFLFNTWLPRVSKDVAPIGTPSTYRNNLALVKGGMAMLHYFTALGAQNERLKNECGTVSAIGGILKAPLDILGDKLRGYYGLAHDLIEQPAKVLAACRALMPHLMHVALTSADPDKIVPITIWMHRGCVPFVTPHTFETIYWPTLRPIVETLWAHGHQVLFYAEGNWDAHLDTFTELPERSIIFHIDRSDYRKAHKALHHKFALSGGVPNTVLALGTPQEVRDGCKRLIDEIGADGGYIMDASAIVQNDATVENMRALTDFTQEYGVYRNGPSVESLPAPFAKPRDDDAIRRWAKEFPDSNPTPGVCVPWEVKQREFDHVIGDTSLVKRIWNDIEGFAYTFIWHCLVSF